MSKWPLKMAVIPAQHHSAQRCCSIATQTDDYVTTSATLFNMSDGDDADEPAAPVTEHVAPAQTVTYATPALVIEHIPSLVIEFIAPPAAVYPSFSQQLPPAYTNVAVIGLLNPLFSITAVEASQAEAVVQEIPEVLVVERIQEQIVEPIEVIPQERVKPRTAKQIVHVPLTQIQEQSAVTGLVKPRISFSALEASQVVGSFLLSEDFAAPVYNQVHQEQIVPTPQAQVIVQEISEVSVVERTQEQIVETIEVVPQERVQQCTMHQPCMP